MLVHCAAALFARRPQEINKEELEGSSMRCGRKLAQDGDVSVLQTRGAEVGELQGMGLSPTAGRAL